MKREELLYDKERSLRKECVRVPQTTLDSNNYMSSTELLMQDSKATPREVQGEVEAEKPYYEAYLKKTYTIKDIVKNFADYKKSHEKEEIYKKRREARQRSLYDLMEKDLRRTCGKTHISFGTRTSALEGNKKVETMVRRNTYEASQKNLTTLFKLLDRLNEHYYHTKQFN
eukprot:TRINITY_DN5260_c0_g1_i3.p1 TRINITY_DN5260_c0_g1~~TRINITY_DN5260_c0_g1_i3.p1  ORF type:complete len:171 (+),score=38.14 TRINITY_DN5260_c0_g1_i3:158-670(+)